MNISFKDRNFVDRYYANELLKIESGERLNSILPIFTYF